jgi:hypothetical protein
MSKFKVKVSEREPEGREEEKTPLQSDMLTVVADHVPDRYRPDARESGKSEGPEPLLPLDD